MIVRHRGYSHWDCSHLVSSKTIALEWLGPVAGFSGWLHHNPPNNRPPTGQSAQQSTHNPYANPYKTHEAQMKKLPNDLNQEARKPEQSSDKGNVLSIVDRINAKRDVSEKIYLCRAEVKKGRSDDDNEVH